MDTQIGLLGEKYSLALDDGSAFNSYNLMLTNLLLYLANVISHDFFIHFGTSFSPSARPKMSREKSVSREISPLTDIFNISVVPQPIKLFITTNGGLVYQVFSAIDTIQGLRVPVHTYCQGIVASAAHY